ncbi:hypothetical protein SISNIDRAFT_461245 [Sistotremastrum niveocremeum HHB9708]|uniref:Mediator complex subunit 8 n=2 Tax=Sistotremastraceae TaxID=3402574 RepID=A0A164MV83_9AGAM|nr:hypothetical protein SISNIDRAFT_461245 [Sistotremastrum niveocremeum HHB9708]KZT37782.1 hypothetical protein SISSUDRAFT_1047983 [Sistotremastrum suecicum HHB10207 ss-3]
MSSAQPAAVPPDPRLTFNSSSLPISQLESLRFRTNQIIESIQALQNALAGFGEPGVTVPPGQALMTMPPWQDILARYNIILSQTHTMSLSLAATLPPVQGGPKVSNINLYERLALHPSNSVSDAQLDTDLVPLLRNQQTTQVLNVESQSVARLLKAGIRVPGASFPGYSGPVTGPTEDIESVRSAHDSRVERAVRAVSMLRDKYDWKVRVDIEDEVPMEEETQGVSTVDTPDDDMAGLFGSKDNMSTPGGDIGLSQSQVASPDIVMPTASSSSSSPNDEDEDLEDVMDMIDPAADRIPTPEAVTEQPAQPVVEEPPQS